MCDPFTLLLGFGSIASALFSKSSTPPQARVPDAAPTRTPGATVRVGTKDEMTTPEATPTARAFTETRAAGTALAGLGRSGLAL